MTCSLKTVVVLGIIFAALDIIHALVTLAFYGHQFYIHYYCQWSHGIRDCEFFLYETNHSTRVYIGIAEGLICLLVAILLIVAIVKRNVVLTWLWLIKALLVLAVNGYFIVDWIVKRGRYYLHYYNPGEQDQELLYIYAGVGLSLLELLYTFFFCCIAGAFSYRVHKERSRSRETVL